MEITASLERQSVFVQFLCLFEVPHRGFLMPEENVFPSPLSRFRLRAA